MRRNRHKPKREKEQGEKCQEHVKRDGLAKRDAIRENPGQGAHHVLEHAIHFLSWGKLYGKRRKRHIVLRKALPVGLLPPKAQQVKLRQAMNLRDQGARVAGAPECMKFGEIVIVQWTRQRKP
jgi:hypothetical protein